MNGQITYRSPAWLPGGHAQTIWPILRKSAPPAYRRERWDAPDGDFIEGLSPAISIDQKSTIRLFFF